MIRSGHPTKDLIDLYDQRVSSGEIQVPLYWIKRSVGWIINLSDDGSIRSVDCLGKDKEDAILPDLLTARTSGLAPSLAHDTFKYLNDGKSWALWRLKHLAFADRLGYPKAFANFIKSDCPPLSEGSKNWVKILESSKNSEKTAQSQFFVLRLPNCEMVHNLHSIKSFWKEENILDWQNEGLEEKDKSYVKPGFSSITGKWGKLTPYHASFGSCIPGGKNGAKFGSINEDASCYYSYDQKGAFCVPMTIEETFKLKAAIQDLSFCDKEYKVRLTTGEHRKFSVWKKKMKDSSTLILAWGPSSVVDILDDGNSDETVSKIQKAKEIVGLLKGNSYTLPEINAGDDIHFIALSAKGGGGRIVIDDYWYEDAPHFAERMVEWYDCTALNTRGEIRYSGLMQSISSFQFPKGTTEKYGKQACYAYRQLQTAIFNGNKLPRSFKFRSIDRVANVLLNTNKDNDWFDGVTSPFRMLRACMKREGIEFKHGGFEMNMKSSYYQLGLLLVKLDDAKNRFDYLRYGRKSCGLDLTPTVKTILLTCKTRPKIGLGQICEKLEVFDSKLLVDVSDGRFDNLGNFLPQKDAEDFWMGIAAGLAERQARISSAKDKKSGISNLAGCVAKEI